MRGLCFNPRTRVGCDVINHLIHLSSSGMVNFLSRLCGGEDYYDGVTVNAQFLSRLCGGEVAILQ